MYILCSHGESNPDLRREREPSEPLDDESQYHYIYTKTDGIASFILKWSFDKPACRQAGSGTYIFSCYTFSMANLLEFYGEECSHCIAMRPLIERLERELDVEVRRYEVWHNVENRKLLLQYDQDNCGGVPFFYNSETKEWICGEADYETFKKWAMGGTQSKNDGSKTTI